MLVRDLPEPAQNGCSGVVGGDGGEFNRQGLPAVLAVRSGCLHSLWLEPWCSDSGASTLCSCGGSSDDIDDYDDGRWGRRPRLLLCSLTASGWGWRSSWRATGVRPARRTPRICASSPSGAWNTVARPNKKALSNAHRPRMSAALVWTTSLARSAWTATSSAPSSSQPASPAPATTPSSPRTDDRYRTRPFCGVRANVS